MWKRSREPIRSRPPVRASIAARARPAQSASALLTNINFVKSMLKNVAPDVDDALSDSALSCAMLSQFIGNLDVVAGGLLDSAPLRRPTAARQAVAESVARLKLQSASVEIDVQVLAGNHAPQLRWWSPASSGERSITSWPTRCSMRPEEPSRNRVCGPSRSRVRAGRRRRARSAARVPRAGAHRGGAVHRQADLRGPIRARDRALLCVPSGTGCRGRGDLERSRGPFLLEISAPLAP